MRQSSLEYVNWQITALLPAERAGSDDPRIGHGFDRRRNVLMTPLASDHERIEMLRHASIKTTGDVYVQTIEESVLAAVNSRTPAVLGDWKLPEKNLGLKGRNLKGLNEIRRSSAKSISEVAVNY